MHHAGQLEEAGIASKGNESSGALCCRDLVSMPSLGVNGGQKLTRRLKRQYNETYHVTPVSSGSHAAAWHAAAACWNNRTLQDAPWGI